MAIVPAWLVDQKEIEAAVKRAEATLCPDVVRIRYHLGQDWTGEPAVYFKVVITDESARPREKLFPVTQRIRERVLAEVNPYDQGLLPYFNFRTVSEQAALNDPAWN